VTARATSGCCVRTVSRYVTTVRVCYPNPNPPYVLPPNSSSPGVLDLRIKYIGLTLKSSPYTTLYFLVCIRILLPHSFKIAQSGNIGSRNVSQYQMGSQNRLLGFFSRSNSSRRTLKSLQSYNSISCWSLVQSPESIKPCTLQIVKPKQNKWHGALDERFFERSVSALLHSIDVMSRVLDTYLAFKLRKTLTSKKPQRIVN
jgi:hypothetical protein